MKPERRRILERNRDAGRYVVGIGGQLRPQHIHHAPRDARGMIEHRAAADSPTVYATRG